MSPSDTTTGDRLRQVFAGRQAELRRITAAMTRPDFAGVALIGAEGVGKSRLQVEAAAIADPATYRVIHAATTPATAAVPFGALAEHLPSGLLSLPFNGIALRVAGDALRKLAGKRRLVLVADDAHLLDEASAALALQLARRGELFILTTVRRGRRLPRPIADLWTGGLAEWIEVGPLTRDDVEEMLIRSLPGQVEGLLVQRCWEMTAGNALLLRELVTAQLAAGRLAERDGMWRLTGSFAIPSWLVSLVDERLAASPPECRPALELLAFAEPIDPGALAALVPPGSLEAAEAHGLVTVEQVGGRDRARLTYPLYGEVLRAATPRLRAQRWRSECAGIVEATSSDPMDLARAAGWRLASGPPPDPDRLVAAAQTAWAALDLPLAEALGRRAVAAGRGVAMAEPLGYSLLFTGRAAEAEGMLAGLGTPADEAGRARVAAVRAMNLHVGLDRTEQADELLRATITGLTDQPARARLVARQALLRVLGGAPDAALDLAAQAPEEPEARVATGLALVFSGRPRAGVAALSELQWPDDAPWLAVLADLGVVHGHLWTGGIAEADRRARAAYRRALVSRWPFGMAVSCLLGGLVACLRGRPREETQRCREGVAVAREHGPAGLLAILLGQLAHGLALSGETTAAARALAEADRLVASSMCLLTPWLELARTWVVAAERRDAVPLAQRAAGLARRAGATGFEALALHDLVRLGAPERAADRLRALAEESGDRLVRLYAAHARAVTDGNAAALAEVSAGFAELGSPLLAAEAAAEESDRHRCGGRLALASAATARALMLSRHCETTFHSPALSALAAPQITRRENEVAELAARGLSSKEISRRLVLSVRTVENHLHRVYRKLGISTRAELTDLRVLLTETVS